MAPKAPMTLYYRRTIRSGYTGGLTEINGVSSLKFISNQYMTKSDYETSTKDIIDFSGVRVPKNDDVGLPGTYLETVTIIARPYQSENGSNMITATANFIDNGSGEGTETDYVNYTVTGASGKFAGYKNIKIMYNKDKIRRTVILS
jgi:hypothetical protein